MMFHNYWERLLAVANTWRFLFLSLLALDVLVDANTLVKMCLSGYVPSGYARSDPIISQDCPSDHIHTFYGPQNIHPAITYEEILRTPARFSSTPFVENQSLYWHPTFYEVVDDNGVNKYIRTESESTLYYRWDNSVHPRTEAFPPGFRMIAHSSDIRANLGQLFDNDTNLLSECCFHQDDEIECDSTPGLHFPTSSCDYLEILFAMPTCWDGVSLGDDNDHKSHMSYTMNGRVDGPCPTGFNRRFPQVQLTTWISNYKGGTYQLSDGSNDVYHVDFLNGWKEGKLQEIIDNCNPQNDEDNGYHPHCACTPEEGDQFMTTNDETAGAPCDTDLRNLIIDEATDVTGELPRGLCEGSKPTTKFWKQLSDDLFECVRNISGDEDNEGESEEGSGDNKSESKSISEDEKSESEDRESKSKSKSEDEGSTSEDLKSESESEDERSESEDQESESDGDLEENETIAFCLSGDSTVESLHRGIIPLSMVYLGESIHVGNGKYEPIYSFGHYGPSVRNAKMRKISTHAGTTFTISDNHLIFTEDNKAVPSANLAIGTRLQSSSKIHESSSGDEQITSIERVRSNEGVYAPFTTSGKFVVGGNVVVSCYVAILQVDNNQILTQNQHWLAHAFTFPRRVLCLYLSQCYDEKYDPDSGISLWIDPYFVFAQWFIGHLSSNGINNFFILLLFLGFGILTMGCMMLLFIFLANMMVVNYCFRLKRKTSR